MVTLRKFAICCLANILVVSSGLASTPPRPVQAREDALAVSWERFSFRQSIFREALQGDEGMSSEAVSAALHAVPGEFAEKKSRGRAFLQSLLLPGWGQYYAHSRTMMKVFVASEVLLWGTYAGFTTWSNWLEDDFRTFAVEHAGAPVQGKPDDYFVDIGNFDNIESYNQAQLRDRDVNDLYPATDEFAWNWDSAENRVKFEDLRVRSDRASNRAELTLAGIFFNHLVSAIHSTLAVYQFNKNVDRQKVGFRLDYDNRSANRAIVLTIQKPF